MSANSTTFHDDATEGSSAKEKLSEAASQAKDKASDLGRAAVDKINENRSTASAGLQSAAGTLHDHADNLPGGEKVSSLAHATADKLNTTAEYVRDHDVKSMVADIEQIVKKNPGASLLAAGVLGFLFGRAFRSND